MKTGFKLNASAGPSSKPEEKFDLSALEPIVDQLLSGNQISKAATQDIANRLQGLGLPQVLDQTEQLRLALRLLECHDDSAPVAPKRASVGSKKSRRAPEAGL